MNVSDCDDAIGANERFYAAFAARDLGAMDDLWAVGVVVSCVHPGWMSLETRDEIMQSWAAIVANPEQPRVVCGGATAQVVGDIAVVRCREFVAGSGMVATNIFLRQGGSWRLIQHHSSGVAYIPR